MRTTDIKDYIKWKLKKASKSKRGMKTMEQRELDWIIIGSKDPDKYLYAAGRAFQNFEIIHLCAAGRNNATMDHIVSILLNIGAEKISKKMEEIKGTNSKDDHYPMTVITIKKRGNAPKEG